MAKKQTINRLVLVAFIFTVIHISMITLVGVTLAFNLFGIIDQLQVILNEAYGGVVDVSTFLNSYYFDLILSAIANISIAIFYFRGYKYSVSNVNYSNSLIINGVIQILFSSYIAGILVLIAGIMMKNDKKVVVMQQPADNAENPEINSYKLTAMKEAVTRLKELRASGAISEEEYYETLNKILEG